MLLTSWLHGICNQFKRQSNRAAQKQQSIRSKRKLKSSRLQVERLEERIVLDATYHTLAGGSLAQDWSNSSLISADNDWSGVPSITGYLGGGVAIAPGTDPQTVVDGALGTASVLADQADPTTLTSGGIAEFSLANPTIALQSSDAVQTPFLLLHLDTTGRSQVTLSYLLRDVDGSTTDSIQAVALQYRIGSSGTFTNLPTAFVADATEGGTDGLTHQVSVVFPSEIDNQSEVQIRILTANAAGSDADEWVGIDDILVSSNPIVSLPGSVSNYVEDAAPVAIDAAATLSNVTSTLEGGALNVAITANSQTTDVLSVVHEGSGAGQIGVAGATISYEGTPIGSVTGGTSGTPLVVSLNNAAHVDAVQALLRAVAFSSTSQNPSTASRTVQFQVVDGEGQRSDASSKTVQVTAVNDQPSFTAGSNQVAAEDAGTVTVTGWATGISAGTEEGAQSLAFVVANSNNPLFAIQPAIAADGTLTYTPAAHANGVATVFVRLTDDGGTDNGGVDSSVIQQFTITITAVNDAPSFTSPDVTVMEDSGAQSIAGWATNISSGPADEAGQSLAFTITGNTNPGLFSVAPTVAPDGTLSFTPAPDAAGFADITITLSDNGGTANGGADTSAPQTFRITLTAVNDAPAFTAGANPSVTEDAGAQTFANWATGLSTGPADEAGQTVSFSITSNTNPGLFSVAPQVAADGTLTFTFAPDAHGSADLTLILTDNGGTDNGGLDTSAPQTFTITARPVNDAPSFTPSDVTVSEDSGTTTLAGWATNIVTGPVDEAGQSVTFQVVSNDHPEYFSVQPVIAADGTLTFTAAPNASGTATLTAIIQDNGGTTDGGVDTSAPQTFTITFTGINDRPTFVAGPGQVHLEDAPAQTFANWATAIAAGPADESGQSLSFLVDNDNPGLFTVQPSVSVDGTLTYTPAPDARGVATVTVVLRDNGGTDNGGLDNSLAYAFTITLLSVNDAPSFTPGADQTVNEDAGLVSVANWATNISAGPANEAAEVLAFVVNNDNNSLFAVQPAISPTGTLTYTPAANQFGSATVTVVLSDNGGTENGGINDTIVYSFTITVLSVNDAPTFVAGGDQTVLEDSGAQTVANWATGMSAGPSDEAGQTLTFQVSADNPALFAVQPAIAADGTLTYTPAANAFGVATVTVTLSDDGGTANGGVETSAPQTFTITVEGINEVPSFTAGPDQVVLEDAAPVAVSWATDISAGPEEVQNLTFVVTGNTNPALFSAGPAIAADGTLSYTLAPNANGLADITVYLMDDGGTANGGVDTSAPVTFRITATAVNDAPTFTAGPDQLVPESAGAQSVTNWATGISAGPADEAGQTVTFAITDNSNPGLFAVLPSIAPDGTLTYTAAPGVSGSATISVTLSDDGGTADGGVDTSAVQTFQISVGSLNDAPTFTVGPDQNVLEDAGAVTVTNWATNVSAGPADEAAQTLTFQVTGNTNPALFAVGPAIAADGTLTYTLNPDVSGDADITIVLTDNGGTADGGVDTSAPATFRISVAAVNDVPSFTGGGNETVLEDSGAHTIAGWATAISPGGPADEAGQTLTFNVSSDNPALFSVQPAISADGTLSYALAANAFGTATVTVTLSDNGGTANGGLDTSAPQTMTISVTGINDAPLFTGGVDQTVNEDAGTITVASWATGISAGPNESQTLSFLVNNDNNGLFAVQPSISPDGTLTFRAADHAHGTATVTVVLEDDGGTDNGGLNTSTAYTFTITVLSVNDAPTYTPGAGQSVLEDAGTVTVSGWASNISAGPANEASQTLTFVVTNNNNGLFSGQPAIAADGTLTFTPAADQSGSATVTIVLTDNGGTTNGGVNSTVTQTFTIEVLSVNDAPTYTPGVDQTVLEDASAQSVDGWATSISAGAANEAAQVLTFTVTNDNNSLFAVQPSIDANGRLTYELTPDAHGVAAVTVTLSDDGGTDNGGVETSISHTFTITVDSVNDAPSFSAGPDQNIQENDPAQTVLNWATGISAGPANEAGQVLTFNITGNTNPGLFDVAPAIGPDGTLTYTAAANANGFADITVTLQDDGGTANGGVDTSTPITFRITVGDINDVPTFIVGPDQIVAEDAPAQSVAGWATEISAGPANEAGQTLTFNVIGNTNPALFAVAPAIAADGTLTYTLAADAFGSAEITLTLSDNGGTANGGVDTSASQTFTITALSVNDAPTFTPGGDQTVLEDSGAHAVDGWAGAISVGPANEAGQSLVFDVTTNNPGLFAVQPALDANGRLTYSLAADANGVATVTVVLRDDGGTDNGGSDASTPVTFQIAVTAVNDAPSFIKGANETVLEDAFPQTVPNWATSISRGPANEAGQTLTFVVTGNTNPGLFSSGPSISPDGTLTYTLTPDASGFADITFVLSDNGGTANGGVDTTAPQTFRITVAPVNDRPTFDMGPDVTVLEDAPPQAFNNWATNLSAGPADEGGQSLSFHLNNNNNAMFSVQPTITPSGTLNFTLAPNAVGTAIVEVVLEDNGDTTNGGFNTSISRTFTISVTPVNDPPSFTPGANQTVLEDAGPVTVTNWASQIAAGPIDENGQTYSFVVTNDNLGLFSAQPAIATNGTLTYTPAANANGVATVTVVLTDNGGLANGGANSSIAITFTITVTAVNDAPAFVKGTDQIVNEDAGLQTVAGWATGITAGPADEAGQSLTFDVVNTNNSLFAVQPSIAANGTLTYTPALNANGSALVSVVLRDNGGTANGGVNQTITQTFVITILAVDDTPTDIQLSATTVDENLPAGTTVGTLSTIDPDLGDTFTYALVSGAGSTNNTAFIIVGNSLQTATAFNFEAQSSYSIRVRTTSSGGAFTEKVFTIGVNDLNEAPADILLSNAAVAENQPLDTLVGQLTAVDEDAANSFVYTLVTGAGNTENSLFRISGDQLLTNALLDFESQASYSIRVRATDQDGLFREKVLTITATNVNETPTDIVLSHSTVAENQPAGTVVGTLTTTDVDAGDTFTYTLVSGPGSVDNALFALVGGQLQTSASLDFEAQPTYSIRVRTTDAAGLTVEKVFALSATNVNEAPTDVVLSDGTIAENLPVGSSVGDLSTTDVDAGDAFTYSLTAGAGDTDNNLFQIVGGQVQSAASFDFESRSSYSIRVRSTDAAGLSTEKVLTVTVTNANEAPVDLALSSQIVLEAQPVGTVVGAFIPTDEDLGDTFTYSLVTGIGSTDNGYFQISGDELQTAQVLDFEVQTTYSIRVRITDAGGLTFDNVFTITASDVDEAPTDVGLSSNTVAENQPIGTTIGTLSTVDQDAGDTFTYTLVSGAGSADNGLFQISGTTLQTNAVLNYEFQSAYAIRVQVTDSSGLTFQKTFTIQATDVNETPLDLTLSQNVIPENQPIGTTLGTLTASDPDASSTFTFTLVAGDGSTDNALFAISGNALRTNANLDFETQSSYSVRVRATDADGLSFEKSLTIVVTNVNEAPINLALSNTTVAENQPAGTVVGTLTSVDADAGETFSYSLVSGTGSADNGLFQIVGNVVQTTAPLNFKAQSSYSIRVRTTDALGLTYERVLTLQATNVNEAPTHITLSPNVLPEAQPIGTVVGTLTTTDPDNGQTFVYELVSGIGSTDNGLFQIAGGTLQTAAILDFESRPTYSIRVRSTDAGGLFVERTLLISLTNVNEAPTVIDLSATSVAENSPLGTAVGMLTSNDPDISEVLSYSLVSGTGSSGNGAFVIDGNVLRTNANLNYEIQSSYSIRVRVVDSASNVLERVFTITVTNANEAPTNVTLSETSIAENQPVGSTVGTFSSTDPDLGDNFNYSLVNGVGAVDNSLFQIAGDTLVTNASLNFEAKSSYSIRVATTDANGLRFEKTFTIQVTNVNEAPTAISLSANAVAENRVAGTLVGLLTTTDPDTGNTFGYSLVSGDGGDDNSAFAIVGNQLQTAAAFDFETQATYSIRVRSTDAGGLSVEQVFTIHVSDEADAPVVTLSSGPTVSPSPKNVLIDQGIRVTDQDTTDFHAARAEFTIVNGAQNTDVVRLVKTGRGVDRLKLVRGQLKLGKEVIGTVTGGRVGIPLKVYFTGSTPLSLVERVLQNVGLSTKRNSGGSRQIQIQLFDPTGAASTPVVKEVVIG